MNSIIVNPLNLRLTMQIHENETLSNQLRKKGYHSLHTCQILKKYLKHGDFFIDAGANIGWYSLIASKLVGDTGLVFAFEPEPTNMVLLQINSALNNCKNIKYHTVALGDKIEEIEFFLNPENYGDHSISLDTHKRCFGKYEPKSINVMMRTLDSMVSMVDFRQVPLMKIDVQGSEPLLFEGGSHLFDAHQPSILMEYAPGHILSAGLFPKKVFDFIEKYRYNIFNINDQCIDWNNLLSQISLEKLQEVTEDHVKHFTSFDIFLTQKENP